MAMLYAIFIFVIMPVIIATIIGGLVFEDKCIEFEDLMIIRVKNYILNRNCSEGPDYDSL